MTECSFYFKCIQFILLNLQILFVYTLVAFLQLRQQHQLPKQPPSRHIPTFHYNFGLFQNLVRSYILHNFHIIKKLEEKVTKEQHSKVKSCYNPLRLGTVIVLISSAIDFVNTPRLYSDRAKRDCQFVLVMPEMRLEPLNHQLNQQTP